MTFKSVNPFNGATLGEVASFTHAEIEEALQEAAHAVPLWADTPIADRCALMRRSAAVLREHAGEAMRDATLEDIFLHMTADEPTGAVGLNDA